MPPCEETHASCRPPNQPNPPPSPPTPTLPGITRDARHQRRASGGRRHPAQKKRKFEMGRPAANTKLGAKRIHIVRVRGGNTKLRALRVEAGNFSWPGEGISKPTRILDVVYNASNNELVRTKTLVKSAVVVVDATPFRAAFEKAYHAKIADAKVAAAGGKAIEPVAGEKASRSLAKKVAARQAGANVDPKVVEQFSTGRLLAVLSSRPGQSGRADVSFGWGGGGCRPFVRGACRLTTPPPLPRRATSWTARSCSSTSTRLRCARARRRRSRREAAVLGGRLENCW